MDRTAAPVNGPFMRVTTRELQAPVLAQSLLAQAQAATKRRDIESILATLKARLKHANMQSDRLEVCRLSIERQDVRQVLHEFNTERNPKEMPSRTQAAAPAIEAPPSVSGQANANNIHASASSEQGPEEILIEAISQIGQLRRKVADLEGILNVENMSTAAEGLSMALVGTARELLMQTKEVTGYARSQERRMAGGQRGGGQRGGGQRLLTEYDDEYDEEYDSDSGIIEE